MVPKNGLYLGKRTLRRTSRGQPGSDCPAAKRAWVSERGRKGREPMSPPALTTSSLRAGAARASGSSGARRERAPATRARSGTRRRGMAQASGGRGRDRIRSGGRRALGNCGATVRPPQPRLCGGTGESVLSGRTPAGRGSAGGEPAGCPPPGRTARDWPQYQAAEGGALRWPPQHPKSARALPGARSRDDRVPVNFPVKGTSFRCVSAAARPFPAQAHSSPSAGIAGPQVAG